MSIDKEKTCYGCPDRQIGCHASCEGYLKRRGKYDAAIDARARYNKDRDDVGEFVNKNIRRLKNKHRRGRSKR